MLKQRSIKKLQNPATQNTRHEAGPFRVLCVHSTFVTTKGSRKGTSVKLSWEGSVPELAEGSMRHFLTKVDSHYLVSHCFICFIWQKIDKNQKDSLVKNLQHWFSSIFCQMKFKTSKYVERPLGRIQWLCGHTFVLFWPSPTSSWTFLTLNLDKNRVFGPPTTSSCPRSHWMSPFLAWGDRKPLLYYKIP